MVKSRIIFIKLRYWSVKDKNDPWIYDLENSILPSDSMKREDIVELLNKEPNFSKVQEAREKLTKSDTKDKELRDR